MVSMAHLVGHSMDRFRYRGVLAFFAFRAKRTPRHGRCRDFPLGQVA